MYSGALFFIVLFFLACFFYGFSSLLAKKYKLVSLVTIFCLFNCFIFDSFIPILLVTWFYFITWLRRIEFLGSALGIVLILFPLVMVKFGSLSVFAIVGLSFMTFRAVDAFLQIKDRKELNIGYVAYLFMPFVMLAGPMYRLREFNQDISKSFLKKDSNLFLDGFETLLIGIVQKFFIANIIYRFALSNLPVDDFSIKYIALNALAYSAFLFFEFSGYSNMAIGAGKLFGFNLPKNFHNPILSKNPQDFWRRWHMSLSFWLRDMIFMPLYRHLLRFSFFVNHKLFAQNIGIFSTLFVMGIWNGVQLKYIVSGVLFGSYSVMHNSLVYYSSRFGSLQLFLSKRWVGVLGRVVTLSLACFALYVFSGRSFIG